MYIEGKKSFLSGTRMLFDDNSLDSSGIFVKIFKLIKSGIINLKDKKNTIMEKRIYLKVLSDLSS